MEPIQLTPDVDDKCKCPKCGAILDYVEGQPVRIVDGKLNMEDTEAHYRCTSCDSIYRRIVGTGYYQRYHWKKNKNEQRGKTVNIEPTKLSPDTEGNRWCPSCSAALIFVESKPVTVIDGKLNMRDAEDHYRCKSCNAVYRRIVNTDYYQWCAE